MKRYVGIDAAQKECALCIVDDAGTILFEGICVTDPDEFVGMVASVGGRVPPAQS